jgi:hypothetical protein
MHYHIAIKFQGIDELLIKLLDIPLSQDFIKLCHINYLKEQPVFRDFANYNFDYMQKLVHQCREVLGWNWIKSEEDYYDNSITTIMHKDLETFLANGYNTIPEGYDQLLHDLHVCLHSMEGHNNRTTIQIEWFNDSGFSLDNYDFNFIHDNTLGAILLQNPYVGHPPSWIYRSNDHTAVWQTCRFHDFVRPGIVINMTGNLNQTIMPFNQVNDYLKWWKDTAPDFVEYHGEQKLLDNSGKPIIGYVVNNNLLLKLNQQSTIKFEYLRFNPELGLPDQLDDLTKLKINLNKTDYEVIAGPDWPSYQQFISSNDIPEFVVNELKLITRS